MAGDKQVICAKREAEYFFGRDWTGRNSLIRLDKFDFWRKPMERVSGLRGMPSHLAGRIACSRLVITGDFILRIFSHERAQFALGNRGRSVAKRGVDNFPFQAQFAIPRVALAAFASQLVDIERFGKALRD